MFDWGQLARAVAAINHRRQMAAAARSMTAAGGPFGSAPIIGGSAPAGGTVQAPIGAPAATPSAPAGSDAWAQLAAHLAAMQKRAEAQRMQRLEALKQSLAKPPAVVGPDVQEKKPPQWYRTTSGEWVSTPQMMAGIEQLKAFGATEQQIIAMLVREGLDPRWFALSYDNAARATTP